MTSTEALPRRVAAAVPFLILGAACVIGGGFTAAITAHAPSEHATWAASYLVLIGGAAQIAFGAGQAWLADLLPSTGLVTAELTAWNLGNAAVIVGTVAGVTPVLDVGGALLIVALVLLLAAVRISRHAGWVLWLYRALTVIVLVSIPVGLVVADMRGQ